MTEPSHQAESRLAFAKAWIQKRPVFVVISAISAAIVLLALARTFAQSWTPIFDDALIWMRTWDVGTRHTPLLGPPSRFGWHHPGPMLFYLLAPLLRLFGGLPSALLVGVFLIALGSTIGIVVLAARTAGTGAAMVLAVGMALLCWTYGDRVIDPWNPHTVVLPFALFLVASWLACCGDSIAPPVAVAAGSFCAQCHLGAIPPVAIIGVSTVALRLVLPPRLPQRGRSWRPWAVALALGLVLWAPPLIEQASASGGNITRLFRFFREPANGPPLGWTKGLLTAGYELLPWGPWLGRERPTFLGELPVGKWWELLASGSPLVIALVLALRFRDPLGVRLVAIGAVAAAGCAVANAQTRGLPLGYLTLWSRSIAMLLVTAPFVVLVRRYATSAAPRRGAAVLGAVAIVSVVLGTRVIRADVPASEFNHMYERIVRSATEVFPVGTTVRVVPIGPAFTASSEAIVVGLERSGRHGRMLEHYAFEVGDHHTISNQATVPTLMILFGFAVEHRPKPELGSLVDRHDPLSVQERKEAIMLREKIEVALRAAGKEDLVQPIRESLAWAWFGIPANVDVTQLSRYLALTSGVHKLTWALYQLPPGSW